MIDKDTVVLDIDGVLADYRLGLLYWIRQSVPELAQAANAHINRTDTWINAETLGVPFRKWLEVLEMFRMSGGKQSLPLIPGALELVTLLEAQRVHVVLLTSRPIDIYSNIYRDTIEWLRNNGMHHYLLLWSKAKAEIVFRMKLIDRLLYAVDDEYQHAKEYAQLGIKTYWLNHYGVVPPSPLPPEVVEICHLKEIYTP